MPEHWETRQAREHWEKYRRIALWLGWANVRKLVPFSNEAIQQALAEGDEHLNKWGNGPWDAKHGNEPGVRKLEFCPHCKQLMPPIDRTVGMWGLVRKAIQRDKDAGREPLLTSWSYCETVCTLKHVAIEEAKARQ